MFCSFSADKLQQSVAARWRPGGLFPWILQVYCTASQRLPQLWSGTFTKSVMYASSAPPHPWSFVFSGANDCESIFSVLILFRVSDENRVIQVNMFIGFLMDTWSWTQQTHSKSQCVQQKVLLFRKKLFVIFLLLGCDLMKVNTWMSTCNAATASVSLLCIFYEYSVAEKSTRLEAERGLRPDLKYWKHMCVWGESGKRRLTGGRSEL